MIDWITTTAREYSAFYAKYFSNQWANMNPTKYVVILVTIGLVGWLLMRNSVKKC